MRKKTRIILHAYYTIHTMTSVASHPYLKPLVESETLSDSSKKQYTRQLQKLMEVSRTDSVDHIIQNPVPIIKNIEMLQFSPSMKKSMVSSVCALFKYNDDLQVKYPVEKKTWSEALRGINKDELERVSSAQPTPKETLNWVDWKTIAAKERELANTEYGSDRHLLLAMYVLMEPVRSDYGHVHVCVEEQPGKKLDKKGENYIMLTSKPGGSYLVLNKYKTSKKYGRFYRSVPDELVRIIAHNLEDHPREFLIIDTAGSPYTNSGSFNKYVNRTLEELFGKRVTINLLRHSFISNLDFNSTTPKRLMEISRNMHHSIGMQQLYRRHVDPVKVSLEGDDDVTPSNEEVIAHMRALADMEAKRARDEMEQAFRAGFREQRRKEERVREHRRTKDKKKKHRHRDHHARHGSSNTSGEHASDGRVVYI